MNLKLNNLIDKNNMNKVECHLNFNEILIIKFISNDQNINYFLKCTKDQIFAEIEEKLYKFYPEYRNSNNIYLANGKNILRFKTIAENNLRNGDTVVLIGQL